MDRLSGTRGAIGLAVLFRLNVPACAAPLLFAVLGSATVSGASGVSRSGKGSSPWRCSASPSRCPSCWWSRRRGHGACSTGWRACRPGCRPGSDCRSSCSGSGPCTSACSCRPGRRAVPGAILAGAASSAARIPLDIPLRGKVQAVGQEARHARESEDRRSGRERRRDGQAIQFYERVGVLPPPPRGATAIASTGRTLSRRSCSSSGPRVSASPWPRSRASSPFGKAGGHHARTCIGC